MWPRILHDDAFWYTSITQGLTVQVGTVYCIRRGLLPRHSNCFAWCQGAALCCMLILPHAVAACSAFRTRLRIDSCIAFEQEGCLERIVALPTPLGSEAAAILREKAPNSKLLASRPADFEDGMRLPTAASMQQVRPWELHHLTVQQSCNDAGGCNDGCAVMLHAV